MKLAEKALPPLYVARKTQIALRVAEHRLRAAQRALDIAEALLKYPDKTLIPWTEWADLREAVTAARRA